MCLKIFFITAKVGIIKTVGGELKRAERVTLPLWLLPPMLRLDCKVRIAPTLLLYRQDILHPQFLPKERSPFAAITPLPAS